VSVPAANPPAAADEPGSPRRAIVFAPFLLVGGDGSRSCFAATVLAQFLSVDIVTTDFDHTRKTGAEPRQPARFGEVVYLHARPYSSNAGAARFLSHLLFGLKAAAYFKKNRGKYQVVYVNVPLNLLAFLVFCLAGPRVKIIDIADIWPDVLPFTPVARRMLAPLLAVWKWLFKSAVGKAGVVMAVSDRFMREAAAYAGGNAKVKRFYIGHVRLDSSGFKQPVFTIVYVGNLGRLYDFDTLLEVLSEDSLREKMQLFIVGKGEREEWLIQELQRRGIRHRFFGIVFEPQRLGEILGSCHVGFNGFINTTAAFSYKATTYFAAGLPIVNSMTGDMLNLVAENRMGENYEGGNREQLRESLLRLWHNGTAAMAGNAERFFASQVEAGKIAGEMKQFLEECLAPRPDCNS
jgi:glycosyltransferase involved in cell wall biosynthesis